VAYTSGGECSGHRPNTNSTIAPKLSSASAPSPNRPSPAPAPTRTPLLDREAGVDAVAPDLARTRGRTFVGELRAGSRSRTSTRTSPARDLAPGAIHPGGDDRLRSERRAGVVRVPCVALRHRHERSRRAAQPEPTEGASFIERRRGARRGPVAHPLNPASARRRRRRAGPHVDGAQDARGSGEDRGSPPNLFTK